MVGSITARNRAISPGTLAPASTTSASASSGAARIVSGTRSEEHTSELQSRLHLVCRLLLEKKKAMQRSQPEARRATRDDYGLETPDPQPASGAATRLVREVRDMRQSIQPGRVIPVHTSRE